MLSPTVLSHISSQFWATNFYQYFYSAFNVFSYSFLFRFSACHIHNCSMKPNLSMSSLFTTFCHKCPFLNVLSTFSRYFSQLIRMHSYFLPPKAATRHCSTPKIIDSHTSERPSRLEVREIYYLGTRFVDRSVPFSWVKNYFIFFELGQMNWFLTSSFAIWYQTCELGDLFSDISTLSHSCLLFHLIWVCLIVIWHFCLSHSLSFSLLALEQNF